MLGSIRKTFKADRVSLMSKATLIQGDSMEVLRTLPTHSVNVLITDPPYGINYKSKRHEKIANDQRPFIWWLGESFRIAKAD
jgi:DNA modification methylase